MRAEGEERVLQPRAGMGIGFLSTGSAGAAAAQKDSHLVRELTVIRIRNADAAGDKVHSEKASERAPTESGPK